MQAKAHVIMSSSYLVSESTSDLSAAEVRYEALLKETNCIEKRFPVDRRKLERLILGI